MILRIFEFSMSLNISAGKSLGVGVAAAGLDAETCGWETDFG